ncbi:MAG: zinc-binding dehydrogenase [Lachnospiraceae bacterium]|jgi:L-iditol 2-dehydrogenase|nr:zinc-binding dehydrogenase [Lachnospiraceae bacterium]
MSNLPKEHYFGAIMAPKVAEVHSEPLREMGPKDVMVKMLICNICTTDYQVFDARRNRGFPIAAGHEWSGEVIAVGEEVTYFKEGDRVAACGGGCGECIMCRMGRPQECYSSHWAPMVNGFKGARNFSNYQVFKQSELIKMSSDLEPQFAAFLEPFSAGTGGWEKLKARPGDTVVVLGAGTMGLVNAQVYHALGYRVIITELTDKKLERARSLGWAEVVNSREVDAVEEVKRLTDGLGADAVVPAVGLTKAYDQAYQMLKKHDGKYLLFAAGHPEPELAVDPNRVHYDRTEIIGAIGGSVESIVLAAKLLNHKLVDASSSWEGVIYPLRDIQKAYEHACELDTYRISVDLQGV